MKRLILTLSAGLLTSVAMADASLTVDVATAHIFRGATVTDELVVQPALELSGFGMNEEYGVIAVGVWGSTAPFDDATPGVASLDSMYETDWYINYMLPQFVEGLDFWVQYTQYQYSPIVGIDEKEVGIGVGWTIGDFLLGASGNFMTDNRNPFTEDQKYFDFTADYEIEINEKSSVNLGGLIALMFQGKGNAGAIGGFLDDGLNHYELDAAYTYALSEMWSIGGTLGYVGQFDDNVLPDSAYDKGLYAVLNLGCDL